MSDTARLLVKELSAFGIVGAVCFAIDVGLFQLLYAHLGLGAVTAKAHGDHRVDDRRLLRAPYWSFSHRARTGLRREHVLFTR